MKIVVVAILQAILALVIVASATPRREVKQGNAQANAGQIDPAFLHYKKALEMRGDSSIILYDLGNAQAQKGDHTSAVKSFSAALNPDQSPQVQSETLYNLGNSFFQTQKFDQAASSYVEALKRNPRDEDAKYNLELALKMMQQQQQQKQQPDQNDQKQDSSEQDQQDQQQQEQQEQDQQNQDQKTQNGQKPPPGQQMTKEEAEQLLQALLQDEQDAMKDVKKAKVATRPKREKDW